MDTSKIEGKHIAVWFSCGAASAVAAKLTLDLYGDTNKISVVNNPIKEEHPDNQRFLKDVEGWLDFPIEFATSLNIQINLVKMFGRIDGSCQGQWVLPAP